MRHSSKMKITARVLVIIASGLFYVASGQQPALKLTYKYPAGKPVKYFTESKIIQTMDIMGQSMQVNVNSVFGCTVKSAGAADSNQRLEITVDTIGQRTESPMGATGGPIAGVAGKSFSIVINQAGKSIDISEAEKIVYNIEGSGESNLSETFVNFFPVLPEKNIRPGDTWDTVDSVTTTTTSLSMKNIVSAENKFEGIETINGVECARITSVLTGRREMNIKSQEADLFLKAPFTGTSEFFFSLKDGYFIRQVVNSKMTGNMEMTYPQAMTFPVVMDISSVNEVK